MSSKMTLEVGFLAGTSIKVAVEEAKEKAALFGICYIKFNFNGTEFSIGRNANVDAVVAEYKSEKVHKYGICHP